MENKYYTPSIEEFFVGFEFETQVKSFEESWAKEKIYAEFNNGWNSNMDEMLSAYEDGYLAFRVKYLDASDIEELGFISEPYFKDVDYFGYKKENIRLYLLENDRIEITTEDKKFESYYFLGVIKNKSELKKVLNMLNIK